PRCGVAERRAKGGSCQCPAPAGSGKIQAGQRIDRAVQRKTGIAAGGRESGFTRGERSQPGGPAGACEHDRSEERRVGKKSDDLVTGVQTCALPIYPDAEWRKDAPKAGPASALHLPVPEKFKLANGLTVLYSERPGLPLVAANLVLLAGSGVNPVDRPGLASMTDRKSVV